MLVNRRGLLVGLASMLAAPAIVHAQNLMPIKALKIEDRFSHLLSKTPFLGDILTVSGFDAYGNRRQEIVGVWDGVRWVSDPNEAWIISNCEVNQ